MDKVIIDGIDVSECIFFQELYEEDDNVQIKECCRLYFTPCNKYHENCYYKQLKRAEQEIKRVKTQYNCYACGNCKGKEDYKNLEKHHIGLRKQFDKYYQALEEIRDVLNTCLEFKICEKCFFYTRCNKDLEGFVLNKINEVIGVAE